jgi:hypothetical protein
MTQDQTKCIYCERNSQQAPLLTFEYRGREYRVCPAHLPILIHKPENLSEKLPGTEDWHPTGGH